MKLYYPLFQSSYEAIATLSESYYVTNITDTLMELLPHNTTYFPRHQTRLVFS